MGRGWGGGGREREVRVSLPPTTIYVTGSKDAPLSFSFANNNKLSSHQQRHSSFGKPLKSAHFYSFK